MALSDVMKLRAQAKAAGVPGYMKMNAAELQKALSNGSGSPKAAKTAVKTAKKTAVKTAGTKTATKSVKSAPAKTAKRPATGAKKTATKATTRQPAPKPPAKPKPSTKPKAQANGVSKNYHGGRNLISNSDIDWTAEWSVSGIRGEIFKCVRRFKGDTKKCYEALAPKATEFWKKDRQGNRINKEQALKTLRWNISRVKFDFAIATGQHKQSKKFGTLGTGRGSAKPATRKASAPARKSTRKPAAPQKRSQGRAGARTKGRKTAGRK